MTKKDFLRELESLLELDVDTLAVGQRLEDVGGWDSLAVVSLMAFVDEKFSIALSADRINACKTVGDITNLLEGKLTA